MRCNLMQMEYASYECKTVAALHRHVRLYVEIRFIFFITMSTVVVAVQLQKHTQQRNVTEKHSVQMTENS